LFSPGANVTLLSISHDLPLSKELPILNHQTAKLILLGIEQTLQEEIKESKRWIDKAKGVYKRDLSKRIELMIWVLENMKNDGTDICKIIESRMDEIINKIKKTESIFELDPLDSELRILNWILYQVCSNEIKNLN
jgi:hypothetical protein